MNSSILSDRATRLFLVLGGFFVANALISEMIGVKLFQLEHVFGLAKADITLLGQRELSFVLSVGVLPWPIVFIMTDLINDYYGVRGTWLLGDDPAFQMLLFASGGTGSVDYDIYRIL